MAKFCISNWVTNFYLIERMFTDREHGKREGDDMEQMDKSKRGLPCIWHVFYKWSHWGPVLVTLYKARAVQYALCHCSSKLILFFFTLELCNSTFTKHRGKEQSNWLQSSSHLQLFAGAAEVYLAVIIPVYLHNRSAAALSALWYLTKRND